MPTDQAPPNLTAGFARAAGLKPLAEALRTGKRCIAAGGGGSAATFIAAGVMHATGRPTVLVTAHVDDADEAAAELESLGEPVIHIPALENLPGESQVSLELFSARLAALRRLAEDGAAPRVIVAPIHSLMQSAPSASMMPHLLLRLRKGMTIAPGALLEWLDRAGYARRDAIEEPGDVALRGGILDVFPAGGGEPVRLDFFGDEIDKINEIDLDTMGSDASVESVELVAMRTEMAGLEKGDTPVSLLPKGAIILLRETQELAEQARGYYERVWDAGKGVHNPRDVLASMERDVGKRLGGLAELNEYSTGATSADVRVEVAARALPTFAHEVGEAVKEAASLGDGSRVIIACRNEGERQRFGELASEHAPEARFEARALYVHRGFIAGSEGDERLVVIPYHELLHRFQARRRTGKLRAARAIDSFLDLSPGDYVVHTEHGIAKFAGLELIKPRKLPGRTVEGEPQEYLTLEFADRARLHVPMTQIDLVQKYVGGFKGKPPLSILGGTRWKSQKERVKESVRDLAAELLRVRAAREAMPGIKYPADTAWMAEFEAEFPYEETEDQLAAMAAIKRDMQSGRPMDRLVCGDVGFGKTELAIRAAFKACEFGKQVAVLVPTTLLAEQHERTFRERFADYPFKVESLSRFKTGSETAEVLRQLRKGQVDLVIGTHRLLSNDVQFGDLGLVVIDEEQRFGVEHKERLLQLRLTVDVLTLSATPIPRTLHMAMLGLRDISSLTTAPADRRAIVTEVITFNERRIAQAISRELAREGQVYFVHNRVYDMKSVADKVQRLAPGARVVVGHGQMPAHELEEVMLKFVRREADILVATTIIESGIDIPTANTMIIDDAHRFGLADLHQLRGRVGRHKHRAYCYLLLPEGSAVTEVAKRRLKSIEEFSMLGAGFKIAMRDLEIRGAGNLLGSEQSGHIAAVGYDMYCRLLDQSVKTLKNEKQPEPPSATTIEIGLSGSIPRSYIPSDLRRMEAYRRLAVAASPAEVDKVEADIEAAYGKPPKAAARLLDLARIRSAAAVLGVKSIALRDHDVVFRTAAPERIAEIMEGVQGSVRVLPPPQNDRLHEVYFRPPPKYFEGETLLAVLRQRLAKQNTSEAARL